MDTGEYEDDFEPPEPTLPPLPLYRSLTYQLDSLEIEGDTVGQEQITGFLNDMLDQTISDLIDEDEVLGKLDDDHNIPAGLCDKKEKKVKSKESLQVIAEEKEEKTEVTDHGEKEQTEVKNLGDKEEKTDAISHQAKEEQREVKDHEEKEGKTEVKDLVDKEEQRKVKDHVDKEEQREIKDYVDKEEQREIKDHMDKEEQRKVKDHVDKEEQREIKVHVDKEEQREVVFTYKSDSVVDTVSADLSSSPVRIVPSVPTIIINDGLSPVDIDYAEIDDEVKMKKIRASLPKLDVSISMIERCESQLHAFYPSTVSLGDAYIPQKKEEPKREEKRTVTVRLSRTILDIILRRTKVIDIEELIAKTEKPKRRPKFGFLNCCKSQDTDDNESIAEDSSVMETSQSRSHKPGVIGRLLTFFRKRTAKVEPAT